MRFLEILKNILFAIGNFLRRLFPTPEDAPETSNLKKTIYLLLVGLVIMLIVAVISFMAFIQPLDETIIPNLIGQDMREAVNILQSKKLIPYFDFQFTNSANERDKIIEQDPKPRSKVRIGTKVKLVVSKGISYLQLANFINRNIKEVEDTIKAINKEKELIRLKKPINYLSHKSAEGTVIAQYPLPGISLGDDVIELELTVSKGLQQKAILIGDYVGKNFQSVIEEIQSKNITFVFLIKKPSSNQNGGIIVAQNIKAGNEIDPAETLVLEMEAPLFLPENKVFGCYTYNIPDFGTPVFIKVEASLLTKRTTLLSQERYGGKLTLPYILDKDAEIILTIGSEEKRPERVQPYKF